MHPSRNMPSMTADRQTVQLRLFILVFLTFCVYFFLCWLIIHLKNAIVVIFWNISDLYVKITSLSIFLPYFFIFNGRLIFYFSRNIRNIKELKKSKHHSSKTCLLPDAVLYFHIHLYIIHDMWRKNISAYSLFYIYFAHSRLIFTHFVVFVIL